MFPPLPPPLPLLRYRRKILLLHLSLKPTLGVSNFIIVIQSKDKPKVSLEVSIKTSLKNTISAFKKVPEKSPSISIENKKKFIRFFCQKKELITFSY